MNLHNVVRGVVNAVNNPVLLTIQVSTGNTDDANYKPVPSYATPGAITGSIAADVLTVTAQTAGKLLIGQTLADVGNVVLPGTEIIAQLSGDPGGIGTYQVNEPQTLTEEALTTALVKWGQVQPLDWRDIQQLDGVNLQGTRRKAYINGRIDGLVRVDKKGGDLIHTPDGATYLVTQVPEGWSMTAGWTMVFMTLQDGS